MKSIEMQTPSSICFFGVDNYRMLVDAAGKAVNGEAVQQVLLARAFKERGFDVSMIVCDGPPAEEQNVEGIRVFRAFEWDQGIPVVRFLYPRAVRTWQALARADADIYFQSPAGVFTGLTAAFCRRRSRKFIFRIASDANCVPGQQLIKYWRDRKIFEFGLRNADIISAQSLHQQALLQEHYGLESDVVNMVVEVPAIERSPLRDIDVLWVNNFRAVKRADIFLSAAARLPDKKFVMVGGPTRESKSYFERIAADAASLPNVEFIGPVRYEEANRYLGRARVLLNTSTVEGFPNSFLQAWVRGTPVVSLFDPDGLIATQSLGISPGTDERLVDHLRELLDSPEKLQELGQNARKYALDHFTSAAAVARYIELIDAQNNRHA